MKKTNKKERKICEHKNIENNMCPDTCRDCGAILKDGMNEPIKKELSKCCGAELETKEVGARGIYVDCEICSKCGRPFEPQVDTQHTSNKQVTMLHAPHKPIEGWEERFDYIFSPIKDENPIFFNAVKGFIIGLLRSQKAEVEENLQNKLRKVYINYGDTPKHLYDKILQIIKEL